MKLEVTPFKAVAPDKAHALKPLEEAAEVFGAWQKWNITPELVRETNSIALIDECIDTIQATVNLMAAIGYTQEDVDAAIAACRVRNEQRGREYAD